ncbi:MAG TPA: 3-keto-5-aminohexanoate cleavage protein [Streptosporangiaceae bacterium]|nr:3-keto-5-aminohexanoate cleavage protein [Streptosporangiaceae bacterium]
MLVKACLNGGTTRDSHAAVPQRPEELAADAVAVVRAGAGAIHLHPRDASGAEVLSAAEVLAAVGAVRAAVPGVPVGVTTGLWAAGGDVSRRLSLIAGWTGERKPDFASVNLSEPGAVELAGLLGELGIGVEAGVWTVADADALRGFGSEFGPLVRILIEPQDRSAAGAVALAAEVEAALDRSDLSGVPRLHHGYGMATWSVLRAAVAMGRDIRVGLEDTVVMADGSPAAGNAALVAAGVALAASVGLNGGDAVV